MAVDSDPAPKFQFVLLRSSNRLILCRSISRKLLEKLLAAEKYPAAWKLLNALQVATQSHDVS